MGALVHKLLPDLFHHWHMGEMNKRPAIFEHDNRFYHFSLVPLQKAQEKRRCGHARLFSFRTRLEPFDSGAILSPGCKQGADVKTKCREQVSADFWFVYRWTGTILCNLFGILGPMEFFLC